MRLELGPVAANVLFLGAGVGILNWLGLLESRVRSWIAAFGLAYLAGVAAATLIGIALLTAGLSFRLPVFVGVCLVLAVVGLLGRRDWLARVRAFSPRGVAPRRWAEALLRDARDQPLLALVVAASLVAVCIFLAIGFWAAGVRPLAEWDAWSIWTRKALVIFMYDALPTEFFGSSAYSFAHGEYPLLVPVFEATHFRAMGTADTQAMHAQFWVLLVAFSWALAFLAWRARRSVLTFGIVAALTTLPPMYAQLLTGYADIPLAFFLALGMLLLGYWLANRRSAELLLAALFLAAAANTKNEGLMAAVIALVVAAILAVTERRRSLVPFAGALAVFALGVLPWRIWTKVHDIESGVPLGDGLSPGYLADNAERAWPSVEALYTQLVNQETWSYVVPVALALVVASLVTRVQPRVAAFYLASGAAFFAALVWVYWVSTIPLQIYLTTSAYRVVAGIAAISLAAVVHLVQLEAPERLPRRRGRTAGTEPGLR